MLAKVRRKLDAAGRVRDFCRDHPFADPGEQAVATRFDGLLGTALTLAVEEDAARREAAAAVRTRKEVREETLALLRLLARAAFVAARGQPELDGTFVPPHRNANARAFTTRASSLLALAREHADTLSANGFGADRLAELEALIGRHEAEAGRVGIHRSAHVGSRARLLGIMSELTDLGALLDALVRSRFKNDRGTLAGWDSARAVGNPRRTRRVVIGNGEIAVPEPPGNPAPPASPADVDA